MIKVTLFLLSLFLSFGLCGQQDSVQFEYRQERGALDSISFVDAYDYVFMRQVETKSLLKVSLIGNFLEEEPFGVVGPNSLSFISFEQKLSPTVSLNSSFHFNAAITLGSYIDFQLTNIGLSLEPRLYLNMRRHIAAGESANNLSGNYFGLQMGYTRYKYAPSGGWPRNDGLFAFLNYGMQRRLLKRGFIDVRAGLGAAYQQDIDIFFNPETERLDISREERWQPSIQIQAILGLAFGEGRPEDGRLCDALLCYREENQLLKIDLIRLARQASENNYLGNLAVAYERKLGRSPFSLNLETGVELATYNYTQFEGHNVEWEVALEPRFYYNLRKRMAQGRSVNNLSANYFTLRFSGGQAYRHLEQAVPELIEERTFTRWQVVPSWGIQRRVFRHGYFAYQFGLGFGRETDVDNDISNVLVESQSRLQLGLAF